METIPVNVTGTTRVWSHEAKLWREANCNLSGNIPAPIDPDAILKPEDIRPTDQVMVHAMGSWYPATVLGERPRNKELVEVEYTSGARKVRRKIVHRRHLVPGLSGYPSRQDGMLAEAWAAGVWEALAAWRARVSAEVAKLNELIGNPFTPVPGGDMMDADRPVSVQVAEPHPAGEPIPPPPEDRAAANVQRYGEEGPEVEDEDGMAAPARRRIWISVLLPVSLEVVVESDGSRIEDATFTVVDVVNHSVSPSISQINEAIGSDEATAEQVDKLARQAPEYGE